MLTLCKYFIEVNPKEETKKSLNTAHSAIKINEHQL